MKKNEWYRDRILWKANQHRLFEKKCIKFEDMNTENISLIYSKIHKDADPVLVFWESPSRWTVLTTSELYSFYDKELISVGLDRIKKQVSIAGSNNVQENNIKKESCFIRLDAVDKDIWAPAGAEIFALMNILLMFPLAIKDVNS